MVAVTATLLPALPAHAAADVSPALDALSLEELMQVEVTSVSGKSETLEAAAAAVFVLDREDLRRSGATNVPDALRHVPGLNVARIDATKWAVSARGFNGRFANKLLVLLDGRQIYSPIFGGVFWDEQHVPFDLIERIEIVRGPGGTIWGANAVNGVINIITRDAAATSGTEVELVGGNRGTRNGYARHAGRVNDALAWRAYASTHAADPTDPAIGDDTDDVWRDNQVGIRMDWSPTEGDLVALQLQARQATSEENIRTAVLDPLRVLELRGDLDTHGGFATAAWTRRFDNGSNLDVRAHLDLAHRHSELYESDLRIYELGARYHLQPWSTHDVVIGASVRHADAPVEAGPNSSLAFTGSTSLTSAEVFAHDEIALSEHLALIVGSKLQHTESTGWEPQPNVRLAWRSDVGTFWGAVSQAVRTPSLGETEFDSLLVPAVLPPGSPMNPTPLPLGISVEGNENLDAERLLAYELGWRGTLSDNFSGSVSVYHHEYDDVVEARQKGLTCEPSGVQMALMPACLLASSHVLFRTDVVNTARAFETGVEVDVEWMASEHLRLAAQLTLRDLDAKAANGGNPLGAGFGPGDPQWSAAAQVAWQPVPGLQLDLTMRAVDDAKKHNIDDYTTADLRAAWRLTPAVSIELLGANLLEAGHREYASELGDVDASHVQRTLLARVTWAR